ncbi:MAG: biotin/lipoyl-containing protein, partial [Veillonella sp.]|nr:biotin/lipoyl-containing protein [Veillonella sp.]
IILKGARPITVRPGAVLPPTDFEHIRHELSEMGAQTTDEDISAYCLYPKVYQDYNKFVKDFGDVSVLDTPTFFFGMKRGEEIQVTIEKGKTLIIKMNGFSEPDEDGNRIVLFEFNGQPRSIKVHDKHAKTTGVVRRKADESNPGEIGATLSGSVVKILIKNGQSVTKGEPLIVTEAMKMETTITAPIDGIVEEILVREGSRIESGDCLLRIEDALKR